MGVWVGAWVRCLRADVPPARTAQPARAQPTPHPIPLPRPPSQLVLAPKAYQAVMRQLLRDLALLEGLHVMDYSLLLGVHFVRWGNEGWWPPLADWPQYPAGTSSNGPAAAAAAGGAAVLPLRGWPAVLRADDEDASDPDSPLSPTAAAITAAAAAAGPPPLPPQLQPGAPLPAPRTHAAGGSSSSAIPAAAAGPQSPGAPGRLPPGRLTSKFFRRQTSIMDGQALAGLLQGEGRVGADRLAPPPPPQQQQEQPGEHPPAAQPAAAAVGSASGSSTQQQQAREEAAAAASAADEYAALQTAASVIECANSSRVAARRSASQAASGKARTASGGASARIARPPSLQAVGEGGGELCADGAHCGATLELCLPAAPHIHHHQQQQQQQGAQQQQQQGTEQQRGGSPSQRVQSASRPRAAAVVGDPPCDAPHMGVERPPPASRKERLGRLLSSTSTQHASWGAAVRATAVRLRADGRREEEPVLLFFGVIDFLQVRVVGRIAM